MKNISLDLAVIVDKPNPNSPSEPSACLGLWRFDHIDIDRCPPLPDRNVGPTELQRNLARASQIVQMSPEELATIQEECYTDAEE